MDSKAPLRPDERDQRATQASPDVAPGGDPLEPESSAPGSDSQPWLVLGLVLLAVFVGILIFALVLPAIG
jgi:hypothetical protein